MARRSTVLLLSSGGLRSLVCLALAKDAGGELPGLLHVHDGRDAGLQRLEHARRQADHFAIKTLHEVRLPHLFANGHARRADGTPAGQLVAPQLLLAAMALAGREGYQRLIWPVSCNAEADAVAVATEQLILAGHLAEAEGLAALDVKTPLLELTDSHVIDLGERVKAPWTLAWACIFHHAKPCGACVGCRRRHRAFEQAGVVDPTEPNARVRAA